MHFQKPNSQKSWGRKLGRVYSRALRESKTRSQTRSHFCASFRKFPKLGLKLGRVSGRVSGNFRNSVWNSDEFLDEFQEISETRPSCDSDLHHFEMEFGLRVKTRNVKLEVTFRTTSKASQNTIHCSSYDQNSERLFGSICPTRIRGFFATTTKNKRKHSK